MSSWVKKPKHGPITSPDGRFILIGGYQPPAYKYSLRDTHIDRAYWFNTLREVRKRVSYNSHRVGSRPRRGLMILRREGGCSFCRRENIGDHVLVLKGEQLTAQMCPSCVREVKRFSHL